MPEKRKPSKKTMEKINKAARIGKKPSKSIRVKGKTRKTENV